MSAGPPIKNIAGQRFGRLVAIERVGRKNWAYLWRCRCDCGNEIVIVGSSLRIGNTKSCGCARIEKLKANSLDLINRRFGRLVVKAEARPRRRQKAWQCLCDCGSLTIVPTGKLRNGHTKSCGCLQPDAVRGFNFGRSRYGQ